MKKEEMKAISRRHFEAWEIGIRTGDLTMIDEVFPPEYFNHAWPPGTPSGTSFIKQAVNSLHHVFPDAHYKIDDQLVDGDKVVTRYRATGTHHGEYHGVKETGKYGEMNGINIDRIEDGRIVESWYVVDLHGYLNYLKSDEVITNRDN